MLTVVEKVLFLQEVDIFETALTEDLAHIAAITEEAEFTAGDDIYREGDISDSMYLVIEGRVRLHQAGQEVLIALPKSAFGTWALFDDEPRVVTATTLEATRLLKIDREDFYDLLADHTRITQNVLKTLSTRLRNLMKRVQSDLSQKR